MLVVGMLVVGMLVVGMLVVGRLVVGGLVVGILVVGILVVDRVLAEACPFWRLLPELTSTLCKALFRSSRSCRTADLEDSGTP